MGVPLPWGQVASIINQPDKSFEQGIKNAIAVGVAPLQLEAIYLWLFQPNQIQIYSTQTDLDRSVTMIETGYINSAPWLANHPILTLESLADTPQLTPLRESGLLPQSGALLFAAIIEAGRSLGALWFYRTHERLWTDRDRNFAHYLADMVQLAMKLHQRNPLQQKSPLIELERQQAEQAWQESQRLIQSIAETSTSILYMCDVKTHQLVYANPQLETILGYTLDEFQSFTIKKRIGLIHHKDYLAFKQHCARSRSLREGEIVEGEYRFRAKDRGWRWLLLRETVVNQQENVGIQGQICGTATDITRFKQAELDLEKANKELLNLSNTDALTHLANRRRFNEFLQSLWDTSPAEYRRVAMILCDIDYFKRYNDTYGHLKGDRCLQQVGRVLRYSVLRQVDLAARYGGEEFAVILPNTGLSGAKVVAERIRAGVTNLQIPHETSQVSHLVTLSLGLAVVPLHSKQTPKGLIAAADQALYQAKAAGRDRYCVSPS